MLQQRRASKILKTKHLDTSEVSKYWYFGRYTRKYVKFIETTFVVIFPIQVSNT